MKKRTDITTESFLTFPNLPDEDFKKVHRMVPLVCVDVLVQEDGKVLLGRRNTYPYRGYWHIIGGLLYYKEAIDDAIKRIAKREIGIDVKVVGFLTVHEYISADPRGHFISIVYVAEKIGGEIKANEWNSELKYFDSIPHKMFPTQNKILEQYWIKKTRIY